MHSDIRLHDIDVVRGGRTVLEGVTARLTARRTAVIGANGSGKSTFARLLNGLVVPDRGTVRVQGRDPVRQGAEVRRRVGFVFADADAQILMPTPLEDIALSFRGLPSAHARERAQEVLARVGLGAHANAPAAELSGGQKQLLALAAVLAADPEVIVADEPTTMLDRRNARMIGDLLLDAVDASLVLVTHDLELAARCDEALLFDEGRLVAQGDPAEVVDAYCRDVA